MGLIHIKEKGGDHGERHGGYHSRGYDRGWDGMEERRDSRGRYM